MRPSLSFLEAPRLSKSWLGGGKGGGMGKARDFLPGDKGVSPVCDNI